MDEVPKAGFLEIMALLRTRTTPFDLCKSFEGIFEGTLERALGMPYKVIRMPATTLLVDMGK